MTLYGENIIGKLDKPDRVEQLKYTLMDNAELKEKILEEYQKGNVVYATIDGLRTCSMEDFVKQPLEGMLYDINRDRVTVTMFLDDIKWVNDYALTHLLEYYYNRCKELEGK